MVSLRRSCHAGVLGLALCGRAVAADCRAEGVDAQCEDLSSLLQKVVRTVPLVEDASPGVVEVEHTIGLKDQVDVFKLFEQMSFKIGGVLSKNFNPFEVGLLRVAANVPSVALLQDDNEDHGHPDDRGRHGADHDGRHGADRGDDDTKNEEGNPKRIGNSSKKHNNSTKKRVGNVWQKDILDVDHDVRSGDYMDGDEGLSFFKSASKQQWTALVSFCAILFIMDMLVLQRLPDTFTMHIFCIFFWLSMAAVFNGWIFGTLGEEAGIEWCSGYFLEWMLSMDNLFVFHLIFKKYSTPPKQIHYGVFVGIFGAVALRMAFFMILSTLLHMFHWIRIPFGLLLVWSGIETAMGGDDDDGEDVADTALIKGLKSLLGSRLRDSYAEDGGLFTYSKDGKLQATVLFVVVICLEATDILFAVDSVSAKVAQIPNQYLSFSSSVIAMFALRAMFFVIEDLVKLFSLLQYGLCVILVFIGVQLIFANWLHMPASTVCALIMSVFAVCIAGSWIIKNKEADANEHEAAANPQALDAH